MTSNACCLSAQGWSAIAAGLAVAAAAVLAWTSFKTMKATEKYVQATREIVASTHNPVIAIVAKRVDMPLKLHGQVVVDFDLVNVGNAPAVFVRSFASLTGRFGTLLSDLPVHITAHLGSSEEDAANAVFLEAGHQLHDDFTDAMRSLVCETTNWKADSSMLLQRFFKDYAPLLIVETLYENHRGQFYRSALQIPLYPEPWNDSTVVHGVQLARHADGVGFYIDELTCHQYRERLIGIQTRRK